MRLLTHNQLICVRRNCPSTYPLRLRPSAVEIEESEFRSDFIEHVLPTIDYAVLREAAATIGQEKTLPRSLPDDARYQTIEVTKVTDGTKTAKSNAESKSNSDLVAQPIDSESDADMSAVLVNTTKPEASAAATAAVDTTAAETAELTHDELMQRLHTVLLDSIVTTGELECKGCKRIYKIQMGIPNMRLNEDEV